MRGSICKELAQTQRYLLVTVAVRPPMLLLFSTLLLHGWDGNAKGFSPEKLTQLQGMAKQSAVPRGARVRAHSIET